MQLTLARPHKSIRSLDPVELPEFAILIGRNGVGKTHFLEALNDGAIAVSDIPSGDIELYDPALFTSGLEAR